MKNKYDFRYKGYEYAPESIELFNHGRKVELNDNSMIQQWIACGDDEKAIPEAKRIVRKEQKENKQFYTIGFVSEDGRNVYFSNRLYAKSLYNLEDLFYIYQTMKQQFEENGWIHKLKVEVGTFIPGQRTKAKTTETGDKISRKPMLVKLLAR